MYQRIKRFGQAAIMMSVLVLVVLLSGNIYGKIQKEENAEVLTETETIVDVMKQERTLVSSTGIEDTVDDEIESNETEAELVQETSETPATEMPATEENTVENQTEAELVEPDIAEATTATWETEAEAPVSVNVITSDSQLGTISTPVCSEYQSYVEQICSAYGIMPELVIAIIETESGGVCTAYNGSYGCVGLMQINESVHRGRMSKLGVENLYDPYSNILVGVDLLSELLKNDNQNVYLALAHYHGERNANSRTKSGNYSSYVKKIITRTGELLVEQGKESIY